MSLEGPQGLGLQVEVVGGSIVCASHTLATAWPGRPTTPLCLSQKEARTARKRGRAIVGVGVGGVTSLTSDMALQVDQFEL